MFHGILRITNLSTRNNYIFAPSPDTPDNVGVHTGKSLDYKKTIISKLDFAKLFLSCFYYFDKQLYLSTVDGWATIKPSGKSSGDTFNTLALHLQHEITFKLDVASCENPYAKDLQLNYGLFVQITRTFQLNDIEQSQIITLQLKDPINFVGLSLYICILLL